MRHAALLPLIEDLRARCRKSLFGIDVERFHQIGRSRRELQRAILRALEAEARLDAIVKDIARFHGMEGALFVQREPYARAVPPDSREGIQPFHIDAYVGHPRAQLGIWVPLADVIGPEGLWLVDDDTTAQAVARGPLGEQQEELRAAAIETPMRIGEALLLSSTTGHGGVVHHLDRTRASFDLRVAREGDEPRGRLGWESRRLA